jgi:endoglucanase
MRRARRVFALGLAILLTVTGINLTTVQIHAETETTKQAVATSITSIEYDVTVADRSDEESFTWTSADTTNGWGVVSTNVPLTGNGNTSFTVTYDSVAGFYNLGYIELITGSEMTVTVNKVTVNGTYELTFESPKELKAGSSTENGLPNKWSGLSDGVAFCSGNDAYLAYDATAGMICFYTYPDAEASAAAYEETTVSSITYDVTVAGWSDEESFTWKSVDNGWNAGDKKVSLTGNGDTSFTVTYDFVTGFINLGYIELITGSEMTVTVNKVTVNGTYALTFDTTKVLQASVDGANGLPNIWSGLSDGAVICSSDNAYLAYDAAAKLIKFYVKNTSGADEDTGSKTDTPSMQYVKAMGSGWNLGNSFDSVNTDPDEDDKGETTWDNPKVTKELIHAVKEKGYGSIRIPMTLERRYTVNENAAEGEYKYVIDEEWLARYKEVVDWAVDEGLYVMINIHHDSWIWLSDWNGDTSSEEYRMYTDFWKQLAEYFKDEPEQVCFETINEPTFEATGEISAQDKLDAINLAAYNAIRAVPENKTRMIVMPTMDTNHEKGAPLYKLISSLKDEYIIATVHYYSEWVYSANLGKTEFDEVLWQNNNVDYTPRDSVDSLMSTLNKQFLQNGIGVIVGEYGLLGYDASENCLQTGEELKYYEYVNEMARQYNVCLMFWDNGSGIDRTDTTDYSWKKTEVGAMLEASMTGRSSYTTGLDTLYFAGEVTEDVKIPLTLNGNTFSGIEGLTAGTDYTYDETTATITLSKDYINKCYAAKEGYGTIATLVMKFSAGADWTQTLVKYGTPVAGDAAGTTSGIDIPVTFNGSQVRRVTAYQASGKVGPNSSWWDYLQNGGSFNVDYNNGTISLTDSFFSDETVSDGRMLLQVEFYDGQLLSVWLDVDGDTVTTSPDLAQEIDDIDASSIICLYAGETEIPSQYIYAPEGTAVYGTWTDNDDTSIVAMSGWPASMTFDTVAHDDFIAGGIVLYYMNAVKYVNVSFGIKDAPTVDAISVKEGESAAAVVSNLAEDAVVSYETADSSIASVDEEGNVTGIKAGSTKLIVTVTQYNRTDSFEADLTVTAKNKTTAAQSGSAAGNSSSGSNSQSSSAAEDGNTITRELITSGPVAERVANAIAQEKESADGLAPTIDYWIYEINMLTARNVEIHQLDGAVSVTVPVPDGITVGPGMSVRVYRLDDDNSLIPCETVYADGMVTFKTNHFSTFIFETYRIANANATVSPDTADSSEVLIFTALLFAGFLLLAYGAAGFGFSFLSLYKKFRKIISTHS